MALIILAHPHLERSVANKAIIEVLQDSGQSHEIRAIHELYPNYQINVEAEQEALLRHDTVVLQYPFYWLGMPAILKQWIDEVFTYQFAYGSQGDKLKGKLIIPSITVGAPEIEYQLPGKHHMRIYEFMKSLEHTAHYAQMVYHDPILFFGSSLVIEGFTAENISSRARQHAQTILAKLQELASTQREVSNG